MFAPIFSEAIAVVADMHLFECLLDLGHVAHRCERPGRRGQRHRPAVVVADRLEQGARLVRERQRRLRAATPEPEVGEEHEHHPVRPLVAVPRPDRELGQRLGLLEVALVVTNPGEQPTRPTHAELVAQLAEHEQRLLKARVRLVEIAPRERHERQVLDRPGLAPLVAELAEQLAGLDERGLAFLVRAEEDAREAEIPQRLGQALLLTELAPQRDRVPQRRRRLLEMTLSFEQLAEHAHRLGSRRTIAGTIRIGERGHHVHAGAGEGRAAPTATRPAT